MFGSCFRLISSLYVHQNRSYSWNFESPLKVSTLLAFTELVLAPEGKFLAIWGALAGQYCQVSTSLRPIGWSWSAFELATKYVSSSWPYKFFLTNVPPFMSSNLLRLLFSLEVRLNNGRTFCRTAGVSDYCHVGLVSCQTRVLSIPGCPLGLLSGLAFHDFDNNQIKSRKR